MIKSRSRERVGRLARTWVCTLLFFSGVVATAADAAEVRDVRIGRHPTFTRVVFELDKPTGYRIERNEVSGISEIVVSLRAGAQAEEVKPPKSLVEALVVESKGNSTVARIRLAKSKLDLKEMILANPPRIVLDVSSADAKVAAVPSPRASKPKAKPAAKPAPTKTAKAAPKPKATTATPVETAAKPEAEKPKVTAKVAPEPKSAAAKPAAAKPSATKPAPEAAVAKIEPTDSQDSSDEIWRPQPSVAVEVADAPLAGAADEPGEKLLSDEELALLVTTAAEEDPRLLVDDEVAREEAARQAEADRIAAAIAAAKAEKIRTDLDDEGSGLGTYAAAGLGLLLLAGGGFLLMRRRSPGSNEVPSNEDDVLGDGNPFASLGDTEVATPVTPETFGSVAGTETTDGASDGDLVFGEAPSATPNEASASVSSLLGASGDAPAQDDLFQSVAADLATRQDEEQNADNAAQEPLATAESAGDDEMDSFTELTPIGSSDAMPAPVIGDVGGVSAQIERLVQELESRVAKLETRLEESLDARERLERQVSAQTEELRVQRAAIARTQRAVRNISQGPVDDSATEPALKQP